MQIYKPKLPTVFPTTQNSSLSVFDCLITFWEASKLFPQNCKYDMYEKSPFTAGYAAHATGKHLELNHVTSGGTAYR